MNKKYEEITRDEFVEHIKMLMETNQGITIGREPESYIGICVPCLDKINPSDISVLTVFDTGEANILITEESIRYEISGVYKDTTTDSLIMEDSHGKMYTIVDFCDSNIMNEIIYDYLIEGINDEERSRRDKFYKYLIYLVISGDAVQVAKHKYVTLLKSLTFYNSIFPAELDFENFNMPLYLLNGRVSEIGTIETSDGVVVNKCNGCDGYRFIERHSDLNLEPVEILNIFKNMEKFPIGVIQQREKFVTYNDYNIGFNDTMIYKTYRMFVLSDILNPYHIPSMKYSMGSVKYNNAVYNGYYLGNLIEDFCLNISNLYSLYNRTICLFTPTHVDIHNHIHGIVSGRNCMNIYYTFEIIIYKNIYLPTSGPSVSDANAYNAELFEIFDASQKTSGESEKLATIRINAVDENTYPQCKEYYITYNHDRYNEIIGG